MDENAKFQQILMSLSAVSAEQAVDYVSLAVIHRSLIDPLPDFAFPQSARQHFLGSSHRSPEDFFPQTRKEGGALVDCADSASSS